ncbi:MAG: D-alanine--D-alanine ligase [Candidatus Aminicenantes bacterium]|nr:D-alanine--D-alanine ligase [Candidatus Aminicenantes bacterium]
MKKICVGLLFGGRSAEHEISLLSARSIFNQLDKNKYNPLLIYIDTHGRWTVTDSIPARPFSESRKKNLSFLPWENTSWQNNIRADIYFPILHGPFGEDGTIQGLLEMAGVPYVGASVLASAVGMDKATAKELFRGQGLPTVNTIVLHEPDWRENKENCLRRLQQKMSFPLFVKPSNLGSSVGITKVKNRQTLPVSIDLAFRYDRKVLVEEGIEGREFECSVLGNENPEASLPGELIPFREFYDYKDKYIEGKTSFHIPAPISPELTETIRKTAIRAFKAIDGCGMARVDFFLQKKPEKLFLNEVNTIPGFTEISMYPKLWEQSGLPFSRLLDRLIELGFERFHQLSQKRRTRQA